MTIYKHYKKKEGNYIILNAGEMQVDDVWSECVIYQDIDSKKIYVREAIDFDLKFSAEEKTNIEILRKYQYIYDHCMNKISEMLEEEMDTYSEFLYNKVISVLPDGFYKGGKKLDYSEVRRLYDKYLAEKK